MSWNLAPSALSARCQMGSELTGPGCGGLVEAELLLPGLYNNLGFRILGLEWLRIGALGC